MYNKFRTPTYVYKIQLRYIRHNATSPLSIPKAYYNQRAYTVRKDGAFFVTNNIWRWALISVNEALRYFFSC
jgi:hypothetical protein